MDAKELRIGNWVNANVLKLYEDGSPNFAPAQITRLPQDALSTHSPIPLTPEILKGAGFREYIDFGFNTDDWDKFPLCGFTYSNYTKKIMVMHPGNQMSHWLNVKIEYVHQLQNLFYILCGEELIIEL